MQLRLNKIKKPNLRDFHVFANQKLKGWQIAAGTENVTNYE